MKTVLILFSAFIWLFSFPELTEAQQAAKYSTLSQTPGQPQSSFSKTVDGISGATIIQNYILAVGGTQQLNNIQSLDFQGTITVSNMQLNFSERKKAPNLDYIAVSLDHDTVMRSMFDGKKGYNQQTTQKNFLTEKEVQDRNLDHRGLFNQLFYLDPSNSFTLNKIEKETSQDSVYYRLDITMPSGKTISEYYDTRTFLLAKTVESEQYNNSPSIATKYFSNYKQINGIMFPYQFDVIRTQDSKEDKKYMISITALQINLPEE